MIKQKPNRKVTALAKKRVNIFQLQKRVEHLERELKKQYRVNQNLSALNAKQDLLNDDLFERVQLLELEQAQSAVKKGGIFRWVIGR